MWLKRLIIMILTFATAMISAVEEERENGAQNPYFVIGNTGSQQTYHFGYDSKVKGAPRLMREETRLNDGTVVGRYGYTDPFGVFRIVQYVAGLNGYYATEDIAGSSPSTPQYFKATARQVDEVREEPKSYSHHLATKFNPPLYHPEAHMAETPMPSSTPNLKHEFRANVEEKDVFRVSDKTYNSRQETDFNYPIVKTETPVKLSASAINAQNRKHKIFSLNDSEEILEGKHRKRTQYSTVLTQTSTPKPVEFVKQSIDKRFGLDANYDINRNNNEKTFEKTVDNKDFTTFKESTSESFSPFHYTEEYDIKNSTFDRIVENVTKDSYEDFETFNTNKDFVTETTSYSDSTIGTQSIQTYKTTESPIVETTEPLPESVKHLYYSPTRTPAVSYTSFSTSVSRISSVSAEIHRNETTLQNNTQVNKELNSDKDLWERIRDTFVWDFNTRKENTTQLNITIRPKTEPKPTEKYTSSETITETLVPDFVTQNPTTAKFIAIEDEPNVYGKSAGIEPITYVDENIADPQTSIIEFFENQTHIPIADSQHSSESVSETVFESYGELSTESTIVTIQHNLKNMEMSEEQSQASTFSSIAESTTNTRNHNQFSTTTETVNNPITEKTMTNTSDNISIHNEKHKENEFIDKPEIMTENTNIKVINIKEIPSKEFLTAFPIFDDFWQSFDVETKHNLNEKKELNLDVNKANQTLLGHENSSFPITTTEMNVELNSNTKRDINEFSSIKPTEEQGIRNETIALTTTPTTTVPTTQPVLTSSLPLTQNSEPNSYIPPLSALFGFPHLRKRVRKVQKIRLRQALNDGNHYNNKVVEQITTEKSKDNVLLSVEEKKEELSTTHESDGTKTTESGFDEDVLQLKSTASDRVYHYVPPFPVAKHSFIKKDIELKNTGLDTIAEEMHFSDLLQTKPIIMSKIDNKTSSHLENNTKNETLKISSLDIRSNDSLKNESFIKNYTNKELTNNSPIPLSFTPDLSDRVSKLFGNSGPKYLFPLEPHFETLSESSQFIPVEPKVQKVNHEPLIRFSYE